MANEATYHADPALGSTDLRRLIVSPTKYWIGSHLNPDRPADDSTSAQIKGSAIHKLLLEGRAAFERRYRLAPSKDDVPGVLATVDDMRIWLKIQNELRDKKDKVAVTGSKAELIERVRMIDANVPIWDEIMTQFEASLAKDEAQALSPKAMAEVEHACKMVCANPALANAFRGGAAEVSVFWEERQDGTVQRFKARWDYLKPRTLLDIKSFANIYDKPMREAVRMLFPQYRLDVQARHYLDGYRAALLHVNHGRVFGECQLPNGWANALAAPDDIRFTWVFIEKSEAALSMGWEISPASQIFDLAACEMAIAKKTLADMTRRFAPGEPWIVSEPVHEFTEDDLPVWMRIQIAVARDGNASREGAQ